jgi:hypothetical protein
MGYSGSGPDREGWVLGFPPCLLKRREATRMGHPGSCPYTEGWVGFSASHPVSSKGARRQGWGTRDLALIQKAGLGSRLPTLSPQKARGDKDGAPGDRALIQKAG